ncbi:MAG TPA: hypothetical protein PL009_05265 [Flavipsychrobacter sp.]|nr:hypothetical protein [Flavipsychrobacter sp.]
MKKTIETWKYQMMLAFFLLFNTVVAFAQDGGGAGNTGDGGSITVSKSTTSTTSTTMDNWYAQPWVWIVGGLIFILLLVALVRGGGSRTDVHRTTTVRKDVSAD